MGEVSALSLHQGPAPQLAQLRSCDEPGDLCRNSHGLPTPVCSHVGLKKGLWVGRRWSWVAPRAGPRLLPGESWRSLPGSTGLRAGF